MNKINLLDMRMLSDILNLYDAFLPRTIISGKSLEEIRRLSEKFPKMITKRFGFETRLDEKEANADFAINIYDTDKHLLDDYGKDGISRFLKKWKHNESGFNNFIDNIWLEYDTGSGSTDILSPDLVFFEFRKKTLENDSFSSGYPDFMNTCLHSLNKNALTHKQIINSILCFENMTENISLYTIGVSYLRKSDAIRICFLITEQNELFQFLDNTGLYEFGREIQPLIRELIQYCGFVILHLDIGEEIEQKISIEFIVKNIAKINSSLPKWKTFLKFLVEKELCVHEKYRSLIGWPGENREIFDDELYKFITKRIIYHVKLVFKPGKKPRSKGYFGFLHIPIIDKN